MASIDLDKIDNIEARWGVKAGDYNVTLNSKTDLMDFQDLMVKFSKNRAVAVEGEVEPLTVRIQQRNSGLNFRVDKNVLIPRPETQELVEWILSDNKNLKDGRILDIGTGSGCIAITLAKNLPEVEVEAWDVSKGALQIATQNASDNEVRVHFVEQDVLAFIPQGTYFDVMVSNPPYITEVEKNEMEANVLEWEPETALFVQDNDALLFYRKIAALGCVMLKPGGMLYFEINRAYGAEMVEMLNGMGYSFVELRKDLFGNDRMVKATK